MGDVDPRQNNFAGIGTTGGGVPGDSFPDVKTGVLGQIQHLVVYSGEAIADPVAPRTQLKQDQILLKSRQLKRAVRFSDLARRWAADPKYGSSIEWVADGYRAEHCRGKEVPAETLPWVTKTTAPATKGAVGTGTTGSTVVARANEKPETGERRTSPVRTIWSRAGTEKAVSAGAAAAATRAPASEPPPPPLQTQIPAAAPAAPNAAMLAVPSPPADEPIATFALLTPPVMLAPSAPVQRAEPASPEPRENNDAAKSTFDPVAHPPSGLGVKPLTCRIDAASFGGMKTVLIRSEAGRDVHFIALTVLDGFEKSMTESFIKSRADSGQAVGEFPNKDAALAKARELCPSP